MSDPRDLLRRYLEQRRELGETEFRLDGLDVDAALAMIANAKAAPATAPPPLRQSGASDAAPPAGSGDWRAALSGAGLGPSAAGTPPSAPAPGDAVPDAVSPAPHVPPSSRAADPPASGLPPAGDRRFAFAAPEDTGSSLPDDGLLDGLVVGQAGGAALQGDVAAANAIEDIARLVAACAACGLGATKQRDVVGEGDPNADFVVVGEAPGEQEDLSGRPFVGASGQLLTKILAAINLPREQVYICNVIKHRPPGNRNPTPAEVAACSPFLLRQLELVKPKVILAVGTFAAQTLLRTKEPIGKLRGRVHRYFGVPLVVTYHPAALLRNPSWKRPTWDDVQLARRILDRASRA